MSKDAKKFDKIIDLIKNLHVINLKKSLENELSLFISLCKSYHAPNFSKSNSSEIKISLYKIIGMMKKKYQKWISKDIYSEIIFETNKEFADVFPNSWEEFEFKKLMESAFGETNKINHGIIKEFTNKEFKKY